MQPDDANRRFIGRILPATAGFVACSALVTFAAEMLPGVMAQLLTAVAILLLMVPFWALYRFIAEIDEFLRLVHLRGVIAGLTGVMFVASGWGYLEAYSGTPPLWMFWLNPLFWIVYAAGVVIGTLRTARDAE